jgi:hypothetical protein
MFKNKLIMMIAGILFAMIVSSAYAYQSHYGSTELTYYDKTKAFNGYTLFSPFNARYTFLIDMEGSLVHSWQRPADHAIEKHGYLLENGNILWRVITREKGIIHQELDWDGNLVQELGDTRAGYKSHHDFRKIWNKKLKAYTLLIVSERAITHDQAIAAGCDPNFRGSYRSSPDGVVELDMDNNVVWEWNIFDHLIQDIDPTKDNYVGKGKTIADYPGKMDANFGEGRRGDWIHTNSLDYNETLDQIVVNNSKQSEFYVIDHGGTFIAGDPEKSIELAAGDAGDFIFRWGNPAVHDAGESFYSDETTISEGDQQMFFTHDIQWIDEGLPGAGNFLIFDNGTRHLQNTRSTVFEINPYDGPMKDGIYVPQMEGGSKKVATGHGSWPAQTFHNVSNQIVWKYNSGNSPASFYARHISGAQRVPNGNTVICAGTWGQFFEVTKDGEVVWEYINPVTGSGIFKVGGAGSQSFRVHRYGPDHPALKGKDLTPRGKLTELAAEGEFGGLIEFRKAQKGGGKKGRKGKKGGKGGKK